MNPYTIQNFLLILILCINAILIAACQNEDASDTNTSIVGEMMAGEMMAGEMMAGEMMAGEMINEDLAIIGDYEDMYSSHSITTDRWTITYEGSNPSVFHIEKFDNEQNYLIAQNDESNEYGANQWSRFDWIMNGDEELWYCQITFEADSAEDAESFISDPSDPSMSGCGTFPWSLITRK